jgi:hypothetical protein
MTGAQALLEALRARGVELRASGGRLFYRPAQAVPAEVAEKIRRHKGALLELLTGGIGETGGRPGVTPAEHSPERLLETPDGQDGLALAFAPAEDAFLIDPFAGR